MVMRAVMTGELLPGRPTLYSPELGDRICERIAMGESLVRVCEEDGMPHPRTIYRWIRTLPDFCQMYEKAKEDAADLLAEEIIEVSDDGRNDWMERNDPKNPGWVANGEHIQRSRLRVDARKWVSAKLKPKKYGDNARMEHTGEGGGPILIAPARRTEIFARMIEHTGAEPKPDDGK